MSYIKVSLGFSKMSDHGLENTANEVITGMTGNSHYPSPPVTMVELREATDAFSAALGAMWDGGPRATALKNERRAELTKLLFDLGCYVQTACDHNLVVLLSSGFKAVQTTHTTGPLEMPVVVEVKNDGAGVLSMRLKAVKRAQAYEVRYSLANVDPAVWQTLVFTQSRAMRIPNLNAGVVYQLQARAVGGSTGHSIWTDLVLHMSL